MPEDDSELSRIENEILRRLERGDNVDPEEYIARFPQFADKIRGLFADWDFQQSPRSSRHQAGCDPPLLSPGAAIGRFVIVKEIGRGGMGCVYLARQASLGDRLVALKIIAPDRASIGPWRARFLRESRLAAALPDHPGIATVYDAGGEGAILYYAMRYVEGASLEQILQGLRRRAEDTVEEPPSGRWLASVLDAPAGATGPAVYENGNYVLAVTQVMRQTAEAVAVAHGAQPPIIHRDLKPGNIMLEQANRRKGPIHSKPVVVDFGLARAEGTAGLTLPLDRIETPGYVAPEVHDNPAAATTRSDVFSLGVTLHDMLTLTAPDTRPPAHLGLAPVREKNRCVDRNLAAIVERATENKPGLRYRDARALAADLRRYLDHEPVSARPVSMGGRLWLWARRKPARAAGWGGFLAVALIVIVLLVVAAIQSDDIKSYLDNARQHDSKGEFGEAKQILDEHLGREKIPWPASFVSVFGLSSRVENFGNQYAEGSSRRTLIDWVNLASRSVQLGDEGRSRVLAALHGELGPDRLKEDGVSREQGPFLQYTARLLSSADAILAGEVCDALALWIEDAGSGRAAGLPKVQEITASPLQARHIWSDPGGFDVIALALEERLHADEAGKSPLPAEPKCRAVELLGWIPTPAVYDTLHRIVQDFKNKGTGKDAKAMAGQRRPLEAEVVRMALFGMGRIALTWLVAHRDADPLAACPYNRSKPPESWEPLARQLENGLKSILDAQLATSLGTLSEGAITHEALAHVLALEEIDWREHPKKLEALRLEIRGFVTGQTKCNLALLLAAAGDTWDEIRNAIKKCPEPPKVMAQTLAISLVLRSHLFPKEGDAAGDEPAKLEDLVEYWKGKLAMEIVPTRAGAEQRLEEFPKEMTKGIECALTAFGMYQEKVTPRISFEIERKLVRGDAEGASWTFSWPKENESSPKQKKKKKPRKDPTPLQVTMTGWAEGALLDDESGDHKGYSLQSHTWGTFLALTQPGKTIRLQFTVPRDVLLNPVKQKVPRKGWALQLEHLVPSAPRRPFGGTAEIETWVNGSKLRSSRVIDHECQEDMVTIEDRLFPGANEIEIRLVRGREYWIGKASLVATGIQEERRARARQKEQKERKLMATPAEQQDTGK